MFVKELSLGEKFSVLWDNILQHPLFLLLLFFPIIFFLFKKHGRKIYDLVYLFILALVLFIGGDVIFELFDNMMNALFMTLYFPNFITLLFVTFASALFALISFFSKKMYKINKIINFTGFVIQQMIFCLILVFVKVNNVDIYTDNALYSNSDLLTLMQLLIGFFTLQVMVILVINGINKVTDILDGKDKKGYLGEYEKKSRKIKMIKLSNSKMGVINVSSNPKVSKLKPFKFDVDKLESIQFNASDRPLENELEKPDLLKPMEDSLAENILYKPHFINDSVSHDNSSDNNLDKSDNLDKSKDLTIDNLVIINIQATLDTVLKFKLVRRSMDTSMPMVISNLDIIDFAKTIDILRKCKLYRKIK